MASTIAIVGAGLAGRLLALRLVRDGWRVTLLDRDGSEEGRLSCAHASAGMLAPSCELESAEPAVARLGSDSLARWPALLQSLEQPVFFQQRGSVVVAHPQDAGELERLRRRVQAGSPHPEFMKELSGAEVGTLEPELSGRFRNGLYFSHEAHLDNRAALRALGAALTPPGVVWQRGVAIEQTAPHHLSWNGDRHAFDWVADCRGLGARHEVRDLRGVRGELLYVEAPEVRLSRPVRLMHPRYPIYIVPREHGVFVVGATAVESEDLRPITVRSTLELLSAAYAVHPGFSEGRLLETVVHCRPAFPDHRPRILHRPGLIRLNGLYRHGFLLGPILTDLAVGFLESGRIQAGAEEIFREIE
jgi:glycine oxidase